MAALALIGATSVLIGRGLSAQSPGPAPKAASSSKAKAPPKKPGAGSPKDAPKSGAPAEKPRDSGSGLPTVQLDLAIAGLGAEGCDVDVKPANPSCKFRPSTGKHVGSDGRATVELRDVELRGADKTCTVAITVREPGQPPQTVYRGFRLNTSKAGPAPRFPCFISSRLAGVDSRTTRK